MKKKTLLIIPVLMLSMLVTAQHLETTIKVVGGKARIAVKAVGGTVSGFLTGATFSVAIPIANSVASMVTPTVLDVSRVPPILSPIANYADAQYEYFNLVYTSNSSASFLNGVEYDLLELNWAGAMQNCPVTLVTMPDGNPDAPEVPSNWFTYLDNNLAGQVSFPNVLFYQSVSSLAPVQPLDYEAANGGRIGSVTTSSLVSLPVSLLNFSGYKSGNKNSLRWTTSNESNNAGFEIQRSIDGTNYSAIGFVNTIAPGGNSGSNLSYTYDDMNPAGKKQYYRLNQKNIDGYSRLSTIVMITGDKSGILGIGGLYPNPASTSVNVIIDAPKRDNVMLIVMDISGKTIKRQSVNVDIGSNTVPVDIASLAKGSYLVKLLCQSSDCEAAVGKFNKQ